MIVRPQDPLVLCSVSWFDGAIEQAKEWVTAERYNNRSVSIKKVFIDDKPVCVDVVTKSPLRVPLRILFGWSLDGGKLEVIGGRTGN